MRKLSTYSVALVFLPVWACAGAQTADADSGSGGSGSGTGGTAQVGSGGTSGSSGGTSGSSGGTSGSTGGTSGSSGGAASTGGSSSGGAASGGAASGGAASGGASSGGAGSGGAPPYEGDCADKPTFDEWDQDMENNYKDDVPMVYVCPKVQSSCTAEMLGEPYLFECVSHHANNCATQAPDDASSWAAIDSCENLGFGGMGGMGGGP